MCYVLPKYYFSGEYEALYPELLALEHTEEIFYKGDLLWNIGEPITKVFYFRSGLAQTYVEHEDGHRKILSFHGTGTIFPGVQKSDYKIERSIVVKALTDVVTTAFERNAFTYRFSCPIIFTNLNIPSKLSSCGVSGICSISGLLGSI